MNYLYRTFLFGLLILGWAANAHAEIITIDGTVKSVDAKKRTITVESGAKERTLDISSKAKVSIDGEDSGLYGLKEGQKVSLSYHDQLEVVVKIEVLDQITKAPPKDASTFESHAYKFFSEVLTWHRAKKRCEEMGGHLAMISSTDEDKFVANLAKRNIKQPENMDGFWLGATDEEKEGEWKWIDGSEIGFSNWGDGQPNNKREMEHYLLYFVRGNKWSDQPDKSEQHRAFFVCEWDLSDDRRAMEEKHSTSGSTKEKDEATANEMKALQGEWKCIAGEEFGETQDKSVVKKENRRVTIKGNSLSIARTGRNGEFGTYVGKFEIDASNGHFDWVGKGPGGNLVEWIGIYELDGDALKLCFIYQKDGKAKRPTDFKSLPSVEPGLHHVSFTFKRDTD